VSSTRYDAVSFEAPAAHEEILVARLWALGCAGSWTRPVDGDRVRVEAFYERGSTPAAADFAALESVAEGVTRVGLGPADERDWLAAWREAAGPIAIGERFLVDPREPEAVETPVDPGGRFLLRLPARTAFGVGSHESTRLAIELLEAIDLTGRLVLDVGSGTGILAFAALRLGARGVVACDVDPAAALLLPQFMALNGMRFQAFAGTIQSIETDRRQIGLEARTRRQEETEEGKTTTFSEGKDKKLDQRFGGGFGVALVNVVPSEIEGDLRRLVACLELAGLAVFSGILLSQGDEALARLGRVGFREVRRRVAGEWLAFVMELSA